MIPENENVLLKVENLKKYFPIAGGIFSRPVARVHAVDGVSFKISAGETLGIVGESGCGKSTTGRLILRLMDPTEGKVWFEGKDVFSLERKEMQRLRQDMTMIFQDPYSSLDTRMSVGRIVSEPLKIHSLTRSKKETAERVAAVLDRVGLRPEHMNRYPHQFSGGQRQRIAIARTLVLKPKLIIADEPVSALDVSVQAQVLNLLMDLQKENRLTYVFIAHDLRVVQYVSNRVAVMYLGRVMELARVEEIYSQPRHPYTVALLSAATLPDPKAKKRRLTLRGDVPSPIDLPPGCPFHLRCPTQSEECSVARPEIREISPEHFVSCHYPVS
jgi:oligopeptide transport system ATP-binding protein